MFVGLIKEFHDSKTEKAWIFTTASENETHKMELSKVSKETYNKLL